MEKKEEEEEKNIISNWAWEETNSLFCFVFVGALMFDPKRMRSKNIILRVEKRLGNGTVFVSFICIQEEEKKKKNALCVDILLFIFNDSLSSSSTIFRSLIFLLSLLVFLNIFRSFFFHLLVFFSHSLLVFFSFFFSLSAFFLLQRAGENLLVCVCVLEPYFYSVVVVVWAGAR